MTWVVPEWLYTVPPGAQMTCEISGFKQDCDLSRGYAGVVEPDHELVGDAGCR